MRIAVIQATSQKDKNALLASEVKRVAEPLGHTVTNYGVFGDEDRTVSYVEAAVNISLLLCSGAEDFVVTGCSSGQGMMLALNSLPGVLCGYTPTPQDAFLFGRINDGNAVSIPLGLGFGWCGEISLRNIVEGLFNGPFGTGYPLGDAERKMRDTRTLKQINSVTKRGFIETMESLNLDFLAGALTWEEVTQAVLQKSENTEIKEWLIKRMSR